MRESVTLLNVASKANERKESRREERKQTKVKESRREEGRPMRKRAEENVDQSTCMREKGRYK